METYTLPHFPPPYSVIHIALFHAVSNSPLIRQRLIAASTAPGPGGDLARSELDYAFVDGRLLVAREHLLTAIQTTLLHALPQTSPSPSEALVPVTRTHNLHSELLLVLSPTNNISEAVRRHGLGEGSDVVAVVRIGGEQRQQEAVYDGMQRVVDGTLVVLDALEAGVDWVRVDKIYKLGELDRLPLAPGEIRQRKIAAVINTVAVKSVT